MSRERKSAAAGTMVSAVAILSCVGTAFGEADSAQIARGEYLARHVAMCVQCHTPRDEAGRLIETQLFQGAPVPVPPPFAAQEWASEAPAIAGLVGFSIEEEVMLLTTGSRPSGRSPRAPMPPFRLKPEDARAIAVDLKSLPAVDP